MDAPTPTSAARPSISPARVLWIGPTQRAEMRLARAWAAELVEVHDAASPAVAWAAPPVFLDRTPAVILLAMDTPSRITLHDAVAVAVRWPLAPLVSVASSLVDGRRRSGPALAGIEEVPWHDLPGRLACWLADRAAGRPGTLGMPATARREDRLLEAMTRGHDRAARPIVSVAAGNALDVEGLADLVTAAGGTVTRRSRGRPPLDEPAAVLVWDVGRISGDHLAWLRMLAANRPALRIVVMESFPRADTAQAAIAAGAAAVLGRPASAEAVAGTLARFTPGFGLSLVPGNG